jgi:hypothetical protein
MKDQIAAKLKDPQALEKLFRSSDEGEFREAILALERDQPKDLALGFWKARLAPSEEAASTGPISRVGLVIILCLLATLYAKLPDALSFTEMAEERFYFANTAFFPFSALIAYFLITRPVKKELLAGIVGMFAFSCLYSNVLASALTLLSAKQPDTLVLAGIHLPFVLWSLLGLAFQGEGWRAPAERIRYLSYFGETLVYTGIILAGGVALTGLTVALFQIIGLDIAQWYVLWVSVCGAVSAPVVATYISTNRLVLAGKIVPLMAKIFAPLLLITLSVYLLFLPAGNKNPFEDRDNLIVFNGMLVAVLALGIFSVVERPAKSAPAGADKVNAALLCVGLLINAVALAAILFRLASYGLTPNRLAVLGSNVLFFTHAGLIVKSYLAYLRGRGAMADIHGQVARFLPLYTAWTCLVAFLFPLAFRFR